MRFQRFILGPSDTQESSAEAGLCMYTTICIILYAIAFCLTVDVVTAPTRFIALASLEQELQPHDGAKYPWKFWSFLMLSFEMSANDAHRCMFSYSGWKRGFRPISGKGQEMERNSFGGWRVEMLPPSPPLSTSICVIDVRCGVRPGGTKMFNLVWDNRG